MSEPPATRNLARPLTPLPPHLLAQMRPELPTLFAEIVREICATIPGYGELLDGPYGTLIKDNVQRNLATFFARAANPDLASPERDELCRAAGRLEALNGHSMDRLHTAYRIGVQVTWRRFIKVARRNNIPMPVMSAFVDTLFGFVDEMATLAREGHSEAKAQSAQQLDERRTLLLRRLVQAAPITGGALADLAGQAAWKIPDTATPIALTPGADVLRGALPDGVLADLGGPRPHLLLPGTLDGEREQMILAALVSGRGAAGLTVPLAEAPHSLRWARQILASGSGSGPGSSTHSGSPSPAAGAHTCTTAGPPWLERVENRLLELWLMTDPNLARHLAARQLAPLDAMTAARRTRTQETLLAWLSSRGNVEQMAKALQVHPQTVRYRMRGIDKDLGPLLDDPEWRLTTEIVLRQQLLSPRTNSPAPPGDQQQPANHRQP
jgi:hypothetical protein